MKAVLIVLLLIVAIIGAGYFGVPILIDKETAGLRSEIQDMKQRLQKVEEFTQIAPLGPDADFQKVVKTVNSLYAKVVSLDDSVNKDMSLTSETIKKQKTDTEEALEKQSETIEKMNKELSTKIQKITFDATMANIRGHILKARVDIVSNNIGTAKTELDLIQDTFEKVKTSATDENKKIIDELQGILKSARAEINTDLPSALNRVDLLWHEMGKLLRKV